MKIKVAYLRWRDGRPRWDPGPHLRAAGYHGSDLKDECGRWLSLEAAIAKAGLLNKQVSEWRLNKDVVPAANAARRLPARTCEHLYRLWTTTPDFRMLAASTREFYACCAGIFLEEFAEVPVAALTKSALKGYWRQLYDARGHHMANHILATVRAMLTHATHLDWIEVNPALHLRLKKPPARLVLWPPKVIELFVERADAMGVPSVADAIIVALHSGQRQGDVLDLPLTICDATRLRLSQMKTRALIDAPMTPQLLERIALIRQRRRCEDVARLDRLILREDGAVYDRRSFNKQFAKVRDAVARQDERAAGLKFLDLRDTAVTRLALSGCTKAEIGAITGHSLKTIDNVMRHYLVMQPEMADAAIAKLNAWIRQEGISL